MAVVGVGILLAYVQVRISPLFALLPVMALPMGLLLASRPDIGLLMVVFIIPFEDFHTAFGLSSSFSLVKLLSLVVFGAAIVHFCVFRKLDRLVSAPQNWLILLFLAATVVSGLVAVDPTAALSKTFKLARVLSLYVMTIHIIRTPTDLRRVIWAVMISGLICALYGIYNYHFNSAELGPQGRISGMMGEPNGFAAEMVARLPLVLYLLMGERHIGRRVLLALTAAALLYGILLAGSRGGLLALVLAMGLFVIRREHKLVTLVLILALVPVVLNIMPFHIKERVGLVPTKYDITDTSAERRQTYLEFGLQLFRQHPVTGVGLHGFSEAYSRSQYRFLQTSQAKRVAHNMYLEIATGAGLLGLIPFLGLFFISLREVVKAAQEMAHDWFLAGVANGIFAGFGGFLLASFFLTAQYEKTLWLLVALTVVMRQLSHYHAERRAKRFHSRSSQSPGPLYFPEPGSAPNLKGKGRTW
jgi:O-antigen ligase